LGHREDWAIPARTDLWCVLRPDEASFMTGRLLLRLTAIYYQPEQEAIDGSGEMELAGNRLSATGQRNGRRHADWPPALPFLSCGDPVGVGDMPVVRTRSDRTGGGRESTDATTDSRNLMVHFQPARRPSRSWWPRSIPAPTELERRVFIASALFMAFVFVLALLLR
jgi:hypothetical protein